MRCKKRVPSGRLLERLIPPRLTVRMRYVIGGIHRELSGNLGFGEVAWTGRSVGGVGQLGFRLQALADELVGRVALEDALPAGVVGKLVAAQQALQGVVRADAHDQHLPSDAAVEAFDHAVGLRRVGLGRAMLHAQGAAGGLEAVGGEATAAGGQHVNDAEGKGGPGLSEEGGGAGFGFLVLDRQVDHARGAVDGNAEIASAGPGADHVQLGQVLDADVQEAKVGLFEPFGALLGPGGRAGGGRAGAPGPRPSGCGRWRRG